jgi:hypothetical protein
MGRALRTATWLLVTQVPLAAPSTARAGNNPPLEPFNPVPPSGTVDIVGDITLAWQSGDIDGDPVVYDVYIGQLAPPPLVASNLESPTLALGPLGYYTQWYWRVVARDSTGAETQGPLWWFRTKAANQPPSRPTLVAPPNFATNQPLGTTLSWTGLDPDHDPLVYDVYIGAAYPYPAVATNLTATSFSPPGLQLGTTYYWYIVARDPAGLSTPSFTYRFTTMPPNVPPYVPTSPSPPNGLWHVSTSTTLSWSCTDPNNDPLVYDLYFGTTTPPPLVASNLGAPNYTPAGLTYLTDYYWRVVARDTAGAERSGPVWTFRTRPENFPPSTPSYYGPGNGATNVPATGSLTWYAYDTDGHAMTYDVYFGTEADPPLVANVATMSYGFGPLAFVTTYRWRIVARDILGAETSGPIWSFTTRANTPPNAPSYPSPANNVVVGTSPTLTWSAYDVDGQPLTHAVYFGTVNPPPLVATVTSPSYTPGQLPIGTYYWRVVVSDGIASTSGATWNFTVRLPGDVVPDGQITLADAACAMEIALWNPGCGGNGEYTLADVDCSGNVTPADARCLHKSALDGSCDICDDAIVATAAPEPTRTVLPTVAIGSATMRDDTLVVTLTVSNADPLEAIGFYTLTHATLPLLQARRLGPTTGFEVLETNVPTSGTGVVGGYSLSSEAVGPTTEFITLFFDASNGVAGSLFVDGFTDDLYGAGPVYFPLETLVDVTPTSARELALHQNHPNPFNPQTTISYDLPASSKPERVRLWIIDISGRMVRTLVDEEQGGGSYRVEWQGRDDRGEAVSSGVYFYVLDVAGGERRTRKLVLLK